MKKMIEKAQSQGWEIRAVEYVDSENCKVLVRRKNAPIKGRPYSVHYYNTVRNLFYAGEYDLTYAEAKEIYDNRR